MTITAELPTLSAIPKPGQQILSVNLAIVNFMQLADIAKRLGFQPEVVQITDRLRTAVHALLWQGKIDRAPADLADKIDELADLINTDAIYSARGRHYLQANPGAGTDCPIEIEA